MLASGASQAFGVATGIQAKFDWKAVAMAGVTAGVTGGLDKLHAFKEMGIYGTGFGAEALKGGITNALTQGVGVATGLQNKFDWAGVAAAAVGAGAASEARGWLKLRKIEGTELKIYSAFADDIAGAWWPSISRVLLQLRWRSGAPRRGSALRLDCPIIALSGRRK